MLKIQNRSSKQIQTTITFYSDVRLSLMLYWDAQNWNWKHVANWNDNNFLFGCPIESHNISRRSKLKIEAPCKFKRQYLFTRLSDWVLLYIKTLEIQNGSSYEMQTTITSYSNVRLSPVIYLDARNWMLKL